MIRADGVVERKGLAMRVTNTSTKRTGEVLQYGYDARNLYLGTDKVAGWQVLVLVCEGGVGRFESWCAEDCVIKGDDDEQRRCDVA